MANNDTPEFNLTDHTATFITWWKDGHDFLTEMRDKHGKDSDEYTEIFYAFLLAGRIAFGQALLEKHEVFFDEDSYPFKVLVETFDPEIPSGPTLVPPLPPAA